MSAYNGRANSFLILLDEKLLFQNSEAIYVSLPKKTKVKIMILILVT